MNLKEIMLLIAVVTFDLLSKFYVSTNLMLHKSVKIIDKFFYLTYAKNTGAAWSIFEGKTFILTIVSFIVSIGMIYWLIKNKKEDKYTRLCVILMLAGAIGNLIDRATLGYVVDFLDFYIFGYNFPIFNIADSALSVGVFLLLVKTLFEGKKTDGKIKF